MNAPSDPPRRQRASALASVFIAMVRAYQVALSPVMGGHCRFHPSCSRYSIEALHTHGALRGAWLTVRRLAKCHPFGDSGFDPVPDGPPERVSAPSSPVSHPPPR